MIQTADTAEPQRRRKKLLLRLAERWNGILKQPHLRLFLMRKPAPAAEAKAIMAPAMIQVFEGAGGVGTPGAPVTPVPTVLISVITSGT
ncbi:MAG: hypothetical protein QXX41_05785 [Nitrososphaerota archaeon]